MAPRRMSSSSKKITKAASETLPAEDVGGVVAFVSASSLPLCGPPCYVLSSNVPLSPEHRFGYTDNPNAGELFGLHKEIPLCTFPDLEQTHLFRFARCSTLRTLITDLDKETPVGHDQFIKPTFLFGDHITADDKVGHVEDSQLM